MQYGEPVPQHLSNSSIEAVTLRWNVSGYNFNFKIIHDMNLQQVQCRKKLPGIISNNFDLSIVIIQNNQSFWDKV